MAETTWEAVAASTSWLDNSNGTGDHELTCRILKVTEEAGEAAAAWIGALGRNPRKGVTHTREQTAAELADVVISSLVAISSLGFDPQDTVDECARKVLGRLPSGEDDRRDPSTGDGSRRTGS
ncbi:hypothetical protein [Stackebrandtia nassauensis]|uniref:NTP pyrophosphohydrolase MazG putative catalytic core domain-containing protein n=1 Tax=Stackebrandtia nassauensis (strain DSM 44728 / CIP 108903 / NRRL B-16338 / NBRC 102104 / LLR-40K-21) TaxID=446470 RepID=D3QAV6_STANL|nr:hypothetical protein [Stackebrandtia nassauensis]ADD44752.1 hypothetical protein Snas_5117 [Stackebrandtia nassauensis DSM 44728]